MTNFEDIVFLKGLDNLGNTCYMNSVLQSLYSIKEFRDYIMKSKSPKALHTSIRKLFSSMNRQTGQVSKSPEEFWNTFTDYKPIFKGRQQHDAQEFLRYIIDGIHEEVNKAIHRRKSKNIVKKVYSAKEAQKQFILYVDDSELVQLFVGQLRSTIQCKHCLNQSHSWDHFWDLSLSIPEKEGESDINECLNNYTEVEVMDKDCQPFCDNCKQRRESLKKLNFERLPIILIIQLKKFGNNGQKITKNVRINEYLVINGTNYSLFAVISHWGSTCSSGHYNNYCKYYGNQWIFFDDDTVRKEDNIDLNNMTGAYILFYRNSSFTIKS